MLQANVIYLLNTMALMAFKVYDCECNKKNPLSLFKVQLQAKKVTD